jgi:signal recognition particle subunit SEC65
MTLSELKREIRRFRKIKKHLRVGSPERKEVNKRLKELKQQYIACINPDQEKQKLIDELTTWYTIHRKPMLVDFRSYTTEQLTVHLARLNGDNGYEKSHIR